MTDRPEPVPLTLSPDEGLARMRDLVDNWSHDPEVAHSRADDILLAVLRHLGQFHLAGAFMAIDKWYA